AQVSLGNPIEHMKGAQELAAGWVVKESTQKVGGTAKEVGKLVGAGVAKKIQKQRENQNNPLSRESGDTTMDTE
ncbi:MAG: hypothetical protein PHW76_05705, partial [Alphaproteobacteria bacterium]|nr:hypothetical protein [Alphaproteobacteria bacterium]